MLVNCNKTQSLNKMYTSHSNKYKQFKHKDHSLFIIDYCNIAMYVLKWKYKGEMHVREQNKIGLANNNM